MFQLSVAQGKILENCMNGFQKRENCRCVYASLTGSYAKGLEVAGSDLDLIVLFVREDMKEHTHLYGNPGNCETIVVNESDMEEIRFWELSSTLDLLSHSMQEADERTQNHYKDLFFLLYNNNKWDPCSLCPEVARGFAFSHIREQFVRTVLRDFGAPLADGIVNGKRYLKKIYASVATDFLLRGFPMSSVHIQELCKYLPDGASMAALTEEVVNTINAEQKTAPGKERGMVKIRPVPKIETYSKEIFDRAVRWLESMAGMHKPGEKYPYDRELLTRIWKRIDSV